MTNALLCEKDFDELLKNKEWYRNVEILGYETNSRVFQYEMEIKIHTSKEPSDKIKKEIIEEIETELKNRKYDYIYY